MSTEKLTPDTAKARIAALKSDETFRRRLHAKEALATAEWFDLHRVASGAAPEDMGPIENAKRAIALLTDDTDFRKQLLDGNVEAKAKWDGLHRQASGVTS